MWFKKWKPLQDKNFFVHSSLSSFFSMVDGRKSNKLTRQTLQITVYIGKIWGLCFCLSTSDRNTKKKELRKKKKTEERQSKKIFSTYNLCCCSCLFFFMCYFSSAPRSEHIWTHDRNSVFSLVAFQATKTHLLQRGKGNGRGGGRGSREREQIGLKFWLYTVKWTENCRSSHLKIFPFPENSPRIVS